MEHKPKARAGIPMTDGTPAPCRQKNAASFLAGDTPGVWRAGARRPHPHPGERGRRPRPAGLAGGSHLLTPRPGCKNF